MTQPALRFIQAGDFHLEAPLGGVSEIPAGMRELFLEAPYRAAEAVFEAALIEEVDGLLLCGDIVDLERAGPRAIAFLLRQFARLAEHRIEVYWAGGAADPPDAWPRSTALPANVHLFSAGRVESYEHRRDGTTVARVQGVSRGATGAYNDSGFHRDANGLFTVGVAYGTSASPGTEGDRVHYMALGGQHKRQTVDQSPGVAHFAGTIQGRSPEEPGTHGCTLTTVDESGHVKLKFLPTDVVRWARETIEITSGTTVGELTELLHDRVVKLRGNHADRPLLVEWHVQGHGDLVNRLRPGGLADQIADVMRQRYGRDNPALWTLEVTCDSPLDCPEEWYDQETILGDMLRQFRELSADDAPLELAEFLPSSQRQGAYAELAEVPAHERAALLLGAARLGLDLIGVDEDEGDAAEADD